MTEWVPGKIIKVKNWTDRLFSIILHAPISPFIAGQFAKLKLNINEKYIQRAYSYVNAPKDNNLEFYLVETKLGKFSPVLKSLNTGQKILITKNSSGSFILEMIPDCKNLWMIATGTAIGPYLSILQQGEDLNRFEKIILIHAVRFYKDLSYVEKIYNLKKIYKNKLFVQLIVSREKTKNTLFGRIPELINNGNLERSLKIYIDLKDTHVMLCGNPNMIHDTYSCLNKKFKMTKNYQNKVGNITSELYWK
ncbi:fpr [Wigglesworthia glossinidia endosymbiont of Glossina brevipalpis]|uniref:Flavodoxin/ferredoxin--NADP reductase n=1 Tax=Wigglesworthia glossinidia brevipalpis TaxID=36870 RepID=Q8D2S9_WIGBR|nr:fpr [Wigglesworthia glossinidia endosymbiont of Glossina brevipalpis]